MRIFQGLKKISNSCGEIDIDSLKEKIQDYKYVSFDLFDTLIKRNVEEPADIFSIMEVLEGTGFREKRIKAESEARKALRKPEITIHDIYASFPKAERQRLIQLEYETEIKAIVPNFKMLQVYEWCIAQGKCIYITTDIYWDEERVKTVLEKNGFFGYKQLYVSSTHERTKRNGSLYRYILDKENIEAKDTVHIGDSIRSDYYIPRSIGLSAIHIPKYTRNISYRHLGIPKNIRLNYLNCLINNTFVENDDPYYQIGYSQFGKLLYGFVHWLDDELKRREIKKVFFLSRDGYIMKKAYEICTNPKEIDVDYLEVSRRSLRVPILWMDCTTSNLLNMVTNAKTISLVSVFDGLGLNINNYKSQIANNSLTLSSVFDRTVIDKDKNLQSLLEEIRDDIVKNSLEEYDLLVDYLHQHGVSGKFAVVDIGYGGSMQRYLQQAMSNLEEDHDITGFYFAVADFFTKNMLPGVDLKLNGYLFDFQNDPKAVDIRSSFVGLFETLFLEQKGSVKDYYTHEGTIFAERYPYEYDGDGKDAEKLNFIRRLQKGALDFLERIANDELASQLRCSPYEYFEGIYAIGTDPKKKDLELFADLPFFDEGLTNRLAAPKSIGHYMLHPGELKDDFLKCRWKTGFMKKLFKVNLPYQFIYEKLRNTQ